LKLYLLPLLKVLVPIVFKIGLATVFPVAASYHTTVDPETTVAVAVNV
jgi:hypothetical protein